jgi:hypothetical protein
LNVALTIAGIVGPALLLVVAIRRWFVPLRWTMAFLFLSLTLAFLNGAVFTTKLPVPLDEVARGYPYRGVFGDIVARNPLTNDSVKLFLPWMQVAREELSHGRAPLWNRYAFSGYPLLANGESAPFSPLFLVTLFVPLPKQIVAMAGLKIFVALLFGFLFLKREGLSDLSAAFGSSAYAFSIFQTVFLYYSTTAVTALLPAALFALFHAMDVRAKRGVVLCAVVIASLMAAGHPESVLHIAMAALLLFAVDYALAADRQAWIRRFRFPLLGAAAGLLLALPTWLPVAEQVLLSTRFAQLKSSAPEPPFPWVVAWAIVAPNGFGNPVRHNWSWIRNYSSVATSYFGLVVTTAFIAAMMSRRLAVRYRLWGACAIGMFLIAMQWTLLGRAFTALPWVSVSANDKLRFVACFLAAAVAARWIDSSVSLPLFVAVGAPVAALSAYAYWRHPALSRPEDLIGVACVAAFAVALAIPRIRSRVPAGALTLCVLELFVVNVPFNALVSQRYDRPRLPIIEAMRQRAPEEPFRVAGLDWTFLPNAAAQYELEDVRGSDPMSFRSYTDFLSMFAVQEPGTDVLRVVNSEHPALDFLNVRFILTEPRAGLGGKWKLVYSGADGDLYENSRALPRFFAPKAEQHVSEAGEMRVVSGISDFAAIATVRSRVADGAPVSNASAVVAAAAMRGPRRYDLLVQAKGPALIVSSVPFSRWWRVRVDGLATAAITINSSFLGFYAPSGESRVTIEYVPLSYYGSIVVAVLTAAALAFFSSRGDSTGRLPKMVE